MTLAANSLLDEAQQTAVINALTRKLALIQGPPGTGKSYTGVALIKVLLDNASKARLGPIVCVCYTNHALDQLLEHLVKDGVEGIICVGSRSKSELVQHLNLRDAIQTAERIGTERRRFATSKSAIEDEADEIKPLLETLTIPTHPRVVRKFLQDSLPARYHQLYGEQEDDEGFQVVDHDSREALVKWLRPKGSCNSRNQPEPHVMTRSLGQLKHVNVWDTTLQERFLLHNHWSETIKSDVLGRLSSIFSAIDEHAQEIQQYRKEDDLRALAGARIIGVTTSGLARNLDVLRKLHRR